MTVYSASACFADLGNPVVALDEKRVENLKKGIMPIYELGPEAWIKRNTKGGRLSFITSVAVWRMHVLAGFHRWLSWDVIAANLAVLGRTETVGSIRLITCEEKLKPRHRSGAKLKLISPPHRPFRVLHQKPNYATV